MPEIRAFAGRSPRGVADSNPATPTSPEFPDTTAVGAALAGLRQMSPHVPMPQPNQRRPYGASKDGLVVARTGSARA